MPSFQLPSPLAPCSLNCQSSSPLLLSPLGHSLPSSLGSGGSSWLVATRCLVTTVPPSSQSLGFAFQLSREPQVLAQLNYTGLIAPEIPIQKLSFMKYKAADQVQDSAPRDIALPAIFGWLWQQCPAESAVGTGQEQREQGKHSAARPGPEKKLAHISYWDQSRECKQPSIHKEVITSEFGFPSSSPSCLISQSCSVYCPDK